MDEGSLYKVQYPYQHKIGGISEKTMHESVWRESYIDGSTISLGCDGMAKNTTEEGTLDVVHSEISYLGYYAYEAWGLSYKVRGMCKDKSNHNSYLCTFQMKIARLAWTLTSHIPNKNNRFQTRILLLMYFLVKLSINVSDL